MFAPFVFACFVGTSTCANIQVSIPTYNYMLCEASASGALISWLREAHDVGWAFEAGAPHCKPWRLAQE